MKKFKKSLVTMLSVFLAVLFTQTSALAYDLIKSDVECYQGIFMKDNLFLNIPLYTDWEPGSTAVGVVYHINTPTVDNYGYVNGDYLNTLGELHKASEKSYYIQNDNSKYGIVYHNGSISVYSIIGGDSSYCGEYTQVSNAGANMNPKNIWLNIPESSANEISVYVNGTKVTFDQQPFIQDGRTLVPVRAIFEALGASVEWDSPFVTAKKGETIVFFGVGSQYNHYNKNYMRIYDGWDVPAQIINDRVFVPLRAVSEAFDCEVSWDGNTRTVNIWG